MKKLIVISLIMVVMLLVGSFSAPTQAQNPASDVKPTFLAPTPGLYVHGWPPFTVSYPKDWVEQKPLPGEFLRVAVPRPSLPPSPALVIGAGPNPIPLENSAKMLITILGPFGKDFNVLYDRPYQLKDGTPAQEAEFEWILKVDPNEPKLNTFLLAAKKDLAWILITLYDDKGKIGEDLKNISYSLSFLQGREEPVKVPPDVQALLDKWCADIMSGDAEKILTNFSDQFLHAGMQKAFLGTFFRSNPASPIQRGVTSCEGTVTVFEAQGDKAYLDGFFSTKGRDDAKPLKGPMNFQQIIKENGQWKWYGNHK